MRRALGSIHGRLDRSRRQRGRRGRQRPDRHRAVAPALIPGNAPACRHAASGIIGCTCGKTRGAARAARLGHALTARPSTHPTHTLYVPRTGLAWRVRYPRAASVPAGARARVAIISLGRVGAAVVAGGGEAGPGVDPRPSRSIAAPAGSERPSEARSPSSRRTGPHPWQRARLQTCSVGYHRMHVWKDSRGARQHARLG